MTSGATRQRTILIVDDDREVLEELLDFFDASGWRGLGARSARAALEHLEAETPDVAVVDLRLPGSDGLSLNRTIKTMRPHLPVIIATAYGDIPTAVEATRDGVVEFLEKPFEPEKLLDVANRAVETADLWRQNDRLRGQLKRLAGLDAILIGDSAKMRRLREDVVNVAAIDVSVLILGETGTGKELVARALHDMGPRAGQSFVPVSSAAIPDGLFESTMFGHVKGAFTGALAANPGAFREADGGTLFLDEIAECPLDQQAKLLRVLEARQITPVGTARPLGVDVRMIAATNVDLRTRLQGNGFRDDLYYRLGTVTLTLPPLRERGDDVSLLFHAYLRRYAKIYATEPPELTRDDLLALREHDWPGNVRELRQVAERRLLSARLGRGSVREALDPSQVPVSRDATLKEQLDAHERTIIAEALVRVPGTLDDVARSLGIGRRTLNEKLSRHGLSRGVAG